MRRRGLSLGGQCVGLGVDLRRATVDIGGNHIVPGGDLLLIDAGARPVVVRRLERDVDQRSM